MKHTIFPQIKLWRDNNGRHINAHGGGFLYHKGTYYWFGEHIEAEGTKTDLPRAGFRCYSSQDLLNWRDEGMALPVSEDPKSEIHKCGRLERPKVAYNKKTGKFVMWFHLEDTAKYTQARSGVAISDTVTGPYTYLRSMRPLAGCWPKNVQPYQKDRKGIKNIPDETKFMNGRNASTGLYNIFGRDFAKGHHARDMTMFIDDDGAAYHIYSSEHNSTTHIAKLTDDYLDHTGEFVRAFENRWMEGPAITHRKGVYYWLASDCTGYYPNEARSAVAKSIWGPWRELGNPCEGPYLETGIDWRITFGGQSTYILKVAGKKDAYIAIFDVWTEKNREAFGYYFFLPMQFIGYGYKLVWMDDWNLSYFDKKGK